MKMDEKNLIGLWKLCIKHVTGHVRTRIYCRIGHRGQFSKSKYCNRTHFGYEWIKFASLDQGRGGDGTEILFG